ncbi:PAS domain S-box protein [candidate division KSB1 bacterium]
MKKPTYEELEKRVKELEKDKKDKRKMKIVPDQENEFKYFLENVSDFILFSDKDKRITYVNDALLDNLKYSKEELIGKDFTRLIKEEIFNEYFEPNWDSFVSEGKLSIETIWVGKTGKEFFGELKSIAIFDNDGNYSGGMSIFRDTTGRKKSEETIIQSEKNYRNLVDNAPTGIYKSHISGDLLFVNKTLLDMAGFDSLEEMQSFGIRNLYNNPADRDNFISELQKTGKVENLELELLRKDKSTINVIINTIAEDDILSGMILDVTDLKKAEQELRLLGLMTQQITDSVIITDTDFKITYMNKAAEALHGYTMEEVIGKTPEILNAEPLALELQKKIYETVSSGQIFNDTWLNRKKDGSKFMMEIKAFPILDQKGNICSYVGIQRDITEQIKTEEALRKNEEKYHRVFDSMYDAISVVDSEIRIEMFNSVFEKWLINLGLSTDIIGAKFLEAFPFHSDKIVKEYKKVLKTGKMITNEEYSKFGDREIITETRKIPIFNNDKVSHVMTVIRDVTEQKKSEKALQESKLFNETILNTSPDVIYIYDIVDKRNVYSNDRINNVLGYTTNEIKGMGKRILKELMHPDDFEAYLTETFPRYQTAEDNEQIEHEYRMRHKNGEWHWFHSKESIFLREEDGKSRQIFGIVTDITNRKIADDKLKRSEELLNETGRIAKVGGWEFDLKTMELYFTEETSRIHDLPSGETPSLEDAIKFYSPEAQRVIAKAVNAAIEHGKEYDLEAPFITAKGKQIWTRAIGQAEFEDGKAVRIYGTFQDITEQKIAEEKLQFTQFAVDSIGVAAYWMGPDAKFIYVNNAACESLGYTREELLKMNVHEIGPEFPKSVWSDHWEDLRKRKTFSFETTHKAKDGTIFPVEITVNYIKLGEIEYNCAFAQNISERKRLEEQLQIRQRMDSLGTLAGGIAHDFNNILVGIIGNIDLLKFDMDNLTESQKEYLLDSEKSSERAKELIEKFHSFSKVSITEKTSVDVYEITKEVIDILEKTTDKLIRKNIKFKAGEFFVNANPTELNQVLMNLGVNAVQAIEEKGVTNIDHIVINAEEYKADTKDITGLREGEYILIRFTDTGIGMSEEVIRRAFDPMFTTKEQSDRKGQGLGLAMVYNIVNRIHKGHIAIESEEGGGTTFHLYLPKAAHKEPVKTSDAPDLPGGSETILIVDDEEMVLKLARTMLSNLGYNVITAIDGKQALEIYQEQKTSVDAVILDLTMPMLSGEMVLRGMLEINPDTKAIISSGHSKTTLREGILVNAKGNINKPYRIIDLASVVRRVLDS